MRLLINTVIVISLVYGVAFPQMEAMNQEEFEAWQHKRAQQKQEELERSMTSEERMTLLIERQKQEAKQYYTGDGGNGIRLAVLEPVGKGLSADEQWMLSLVQGSITGDLNKFSGMTIIDRQNLEKVFAEWKESMSGHYSDADRVKIGNLTSASHILTGSVSKTKTTFMLELTVTDVASGERKASYSPTPVSTSALENLSALKAASADLLKQLGVELTDAAREELMQAANIARIQAETALARGITAQRRGTEIEALSYFFQAEALDASLIEASKRSLVIAANISSGNIGADIRNDILWRKKWGARLKETEEIFYKMINAAAPPYTLYYSTDIKTGKIDYKTETAELGILIDVSANWAWVKTLNRTLLAAQAVLDGLNSTNRKKDWGLENWPWRDGVSNTSPFGMRNYKRYDITVVFELVNQRGRIIGSQTVKLDPGFYIGYTEKGNGRHITAIFSELDSYSSEEYLYRCPGSVFGEGSRCPGTVNFKGVKANDISENLSIRIASVNGMPPQKARVAITAIPTEQPQSFVDHRDGKEYNTVRIGTKTWMTENLNYQPQTGNSWCADDNNSNCDKFGRLYDWNTAINVCPFGWHLATSNDWSYLRRFKITEDDYRFSRKSFRTDTQNWGVAFGGWWTVTVKDAYRAVDYYGFYNNNNMEGEGKYVRCIAD